MDTTGSYNEGTITSDAAKPYHTSTTVAAVFADRERAHDAVHRLNDEGFGETWIGITKSDEASGYTTASATAETRVEAENWFTRFFGEGDESLYEALVRHGVSEVEARSAGMLPGKSAILTVDGANHPELAAELISKFGGQLITRGFGATGFGTEGMYAATPHHSDAPASRTSSLAEDGAYAAGGFAADGAIGAGAPVDGTDASSYDDYGRFRAGVPVDESTRLQLREERLRVDKSRISVGEATVGKEVVTERHEIDVPLVREELFIERRPASASTAVDSTPFGTERDVLRVPLTEEQVNVTKVPYVTEEVVVGKRQVEETQRVSETTRKEHLTVADVDTAAGSKPKIDPGI